MRLSRESDPGCSHRTAIHIVPNTFHRTENSYLRPFLTPLNGASVKGFVLFSIMAILRSKRPDVDIPENLSWTEFVFQNFDKYGDRTAIVRSASFLIIHSLVYPCMVLLRKESLVLKRRKFNNAIVNVKHCEISRNSATEELYMAVGMF